MLSRTWVETRGKYRPFSGLLPRRQLDWRGSFGGSEAIGGRRFGGVQGRLLGLLERLLGHRP